MPVNPYYHPEKLGLEVVETFEYSPEDYGYDVRFIWRHTETGVLYSARDYGCLCLTPFEGYETDDVTTLPRFDRDEVIEEVVAKGYPYFVPDVRGIA